MTAGDEIVDDRWPVVVGLAEVAQRDGVLDPVGLMTAALGGGAYRCRARRSPRPISCSCRVACGRTPIPGRAAALATGSQALRSVIAEIGVLQSTLFARAFAAIVAGEAEVVAVVGGEARYRAIRGGEETPGTGEPDEVLRPAAEIITRVEVERGLGVPAHQYALIESALAHRAGRLARGADRGARRPLGARGARRRRPAVRMAYAMTRRPRRSRPARAATG